MRGAGRRAACASSSTAVIVLSAVIAALILLVIDAAPALAASSTASLVHISDNPDFAPYDELPAPPHISAKTAILIDEDTGRIIFSRKANNHVGPASTTKIMTGLLVLEHLPLDKKVTISPRAAGTGGSALGLQAGTTYTVEQLLKTLLITSANDAAVALAEATSGSVSAFVELMNEKAQSLGLENTHFRNPHGLHEDGHYSSAYDLAKLTATALQNEVFRAIVGTKRYEFVRADGSVVKLKNSNKLMREVSWVTGVKTGSTPVAGDCLVSSGSYRGINLIAVVLGEPDSPTPEDDKRWEDSLELLQYGLSLYRKVVVVNEGDALFEVDVPFRPSKPLRAVAENTLVLANVYAQEEVQALVRKRSVHWPVQAGDRLGTLLVRVSGSEVDTVDLVAEESAWYAPMSYLIATSAVHLPQDLVVAQLARAALQ